MNSHDTTMSAPAAAGGKLRLSDVVRALRSDEVVLDCKAVVLAVDEAGVHGAFDTDRVSVQDVTDVKLLMLHLGLHALALQVLHDVPEATAAVAAADARERSGARGRWLEEIRKAIGEDGKVADSKDGKEDCHE